MKGDHIGEFEELVLLAAQGLGDGAYGVSVKQLLDREARRDVSLGAVYAALDRLEGKGLLRSATTEGSPMRGGRRRRTYAPTPRGLRALHEMQRVRDRLWRVSARAASQRP
jgi:DNA-binding PadR family transcriptional regulator